MKRLLLLLFFHLVQLRFELLDGLIVDRPEALELVHAYDQPPSADFLIQEFFGTDFSRSYLALQTLQNHSAEQLWPALEQRWHAEAHNDYGAHYFFIRLFSRIGPWPDEALSLIKSILAGPSPHAGRNS